MNALDVALVLAAMLAIVGGYRLGFATRVVSWLGLGIGLLVGVRVLPLLLGHLQGAERFQLVLVAVAVVLVGASLGQAAGLAISNRISPGRRSGTVAKVDHALGAVAGLVGIAVLAWLLLPLLATTPGWLSEATAESTIARAFAENLPTAPDATQIARAFVGPSQFPEVIEELSPPGPAAAPPATTGLSPALTAGTTRSTVKVEGIACQRIVDGSGFVVAPGLIVTNAHVVAGERSTVVLRDDGRRLGATVVAFDPDRDVALLAVPGISRSPLTLAEPAAGQTGGVFGHPEGGPLRVAPFQIERAISAVGDNIYGTGSTRRQVLELAAALAPGDSGSAVVDTTGQVVAVAFAVSSNRPNTAYALAPSEVRSMLDGPHATPVSTGACRGLVPARVGLGHGCPRLFAPQHRAPQERGLGGEQIVGSGGYDEPGAALDLSVELARTPPGVADEHPRHLDAGVDGVGIHGQIHRPDGGVHFGPSRAVDRISDPGQAQGHAGFDRAAAEHDPRLADGAGPQRQGIADRELARAIDHHAERAFRAVFEQVDDRPVEVRIAQAGPGDQQPTTPYPRHGALAVTRSR